MYATLLHLPRDQFITEYRRLYYDKAEGKEFCLHVLNDLEKAVVEDNLLNFTSLCNLINHVRDVENEQILKEVWDYKNNSLKPTNLVVLSCKHKSVQILKCLFDDNVKNISISLLNPFGSKIILPNVTDESCHNAFYYAIRTGNVELLGILINKWPNNYFADHLEELDEILSSAYEELRMRNVSLSLEMKIFVEEKLINMRFFSESSSKTQNVQDDLNDIKKRTGLILETIDSLTSDSASDVNDRFLAIAKFIAQNLHILKGHLRGTYDSLPWEEIEFCVVSFISCQLREHEINLFYRTLLSKDKIVKHLKHFARILKERNDLIGHSDIGTLSDFPKMTREQAVADIINNCPDFEELFNDHQRLRDLYSLIKIKNYVELALAADPKEKEGQLVITRALQVVGEHLKDTFESPNLSKTACDLLLFSLPSYTREIIIELGNSLSNASSLSKRLEVENNTDLYFSAAIQKDMKVIGAVIADIIHNNKISTIRILLEKLISSKTPGEIEEIAAVLDNCGLKNVLPENLKTSESERLVKLIGRLRNAVSDKTSYEKELFNKLENLIRPGRSDFNHSNDYLLPIISLFEMLKMERNCVYINKNIVRDVHCYATRALERISPGMEHPKYKDIAELVLRIYVSVQARAQQNMDNFEDVRTLIWEIFYISECGIGNIKSLDKLRKKLNERYFFIPKSVPKCVIQEDRYSVLLDQKINELKRVLNNNALTIDFMKELSSNNNKNKHKNIMAAIEMLVLDIMSILDHSKNILENNLFYWDDNTPLLTGKSLQNYLAHGDNITNIMLFNPSLAVILNARTLTSENMITNRNKIGKSVVGNYHKLKVKYQRCLDDIDNQEKMFDALEEGNLEVLKSCLCKGADVLARSSDLWTALHSAAKGPSLECVKLVFSGNFSNCVKDSSGRTPLHVAAACGRKDIVEFFIKMGFSIDETDIYDRCALHFAAQNGHKDVVRVLLNNNADKFARDSNGYTALHCAVQKNHKEIVTMLFEGDENVDVNVVKGGFTSLYVAADQDNVEMVNFLLDLNADVNAKGDFQESAPLHIASCNGNFEVVNVLLAEHAEVDARILDGRTSLHMAAENGCEKIVEVLIKHGASVNTEERNLQIRPLHYASKEGHEECVQILLKNGAICNAATSEGFTPLHIAAQFGRLGVIKILLEHEADVNARIANGSRALHFAVESGSKDVVALLIEKGASLNEKTITGLTPIHLAAYNGYEEIVSLLIKSEASVSVKDSQGGTALHKAAEGGYVNVIDILIQNNSKVNVRDRNGLMPLHFAIFSGQIKSALFLIENHADINAKDSTVGTPLLLAARDGNKNLTELLVKYKADVNAKGLDGWTPLLSAVGGGHREIVELLIANGAYVNYENESKKPLTCAVFQNNKEIVEILLANGANINAGNGECLLLAVSLGYRDIVEVLLKNKADTACSYESNSTVLHTAAARDDKGIVELLIQAGAKIDTVSDDKFTPLFAAAEAGHVEIVKMLIENGAAVNVKGSKDVTPLHVAAISGHNHVVKMLLDNGASLADKDELDSTALQLAVAYKQYEVVETLLEYKGNDIHSKRNGFTLLHIAAQMGDLKIVKYLIDKGCDINARNACGTKPIHIAAREGHKKVVEFFLKRGMSINITGGDNQTLLHYAAIYGHTEVISFLLAKGADINAKDDNGSTPVHIAAYCGRKDTVEMLLTNGAIYNLFDKNHKKPLHLAENKDVINFLALTDKLFDAVKHNKSSDAAKYIKAGAFVNAKNIDSGIPLHYAAWKGFEKIVDILLHWKADPNAADNKGFTPVHYAAKFSHPKIVEALLCNGAIYNAISISGKAPFDMAVDKSVVNLLKLVSESFINVQIGNTKVIRDIQKIRDVATVKALMRARNKAKRTLVVEAMHNNFPKIESLKEVMQVNVSHQTSLGLALAQQGNYEESLCIFKSLLEERKEILGPDNPGSLDLKVQIGLVLYKQGKYVEALEIFEEALGKQSEMLGRDHKDSLKTKSHIALVYYRLAKDDKAYDILSEVYLKQKDILGVEHKDTADTEFHLAIFLDRLGKHEEALSIYDTHYRKRKELFGANDPVTLAARNNMAMVLRNQGKHKEALKVYREVFERKKEVYGIEHTDTLRTMQNIAAAYLDQKKYSEAHETYKETLKIQEYALGPTNPETLHTQYYIGSLLCQEGKWIAAYRSFKKFLERSRNIFGASHREVVDAARKVEVITSTLRNTFNENVLDVLERDMLTAASKGDIRTVKDLVLNGDDVNETDVEGRSPLHFAVNGGHIDIVELLVANGADVEHGTIKGNTALHTAVSKGNKEMIEVLIKAVPQYKLKTFINCQTTVAGTSSLHVASKNGSFDIVTCLMENGASYNILNKEGKMPIHLSKDESVIQLLKFVSEVFENARKGNLEIINKLKELKTVELKVIKNVRNYQGNTVLQVAISNKHKNFASKFLDILKTLSR